MAETRTAEATWSGDLIHGSGMLKYVSSGSYSRLPVTWSSRTEAHQGKTSPEEFLAAAHATCFAMAFGNQLGKNGTPAADLNVVVEITADKREAGWTVISSSITVKGVVDGIDEAQFKGLAEIAKDGCPISRALVGNVELSVEATLVRS